MTHPNPCFHWSDAEAVRNFVRRISFANIFAMTPDGPRAAQAPLVWDGPQALRFHLARGNALAKHLPGRTALAVFSGPDTYISPDWYEVADQVPTWNYLSVEIEGECRALGEEELIAQADALSAEHEARLAPKTPWTRHKMSPGRFEAMLRGIVGFELAASVIRPTAKLGQNKPAEQRNRAAEALVAAGEPEVAALMRALP